MKKRDLTKEPLVSHFVPDDPFIVYAKHEARRRGFVLGLATGLAAGLVLGRWFA